jgi:DNA invertase Pin-like site-specific DNA recombinase
MVINMFHKKQQGGTEVVSQYTVKYVAIYVRKSRGDLEHDLAKHLAELIKLCEENNWTYAVYSEIGTSDSIELRPVMSELLSDVELGMFDAVCAVHIDRLSRGDAVDRAKIQKILGKTETLLITPQRVYDFTNETDLLMAEFEGLMARMEYKQTSRRFKQGKARNAKLGFWSNGKPPYPYYRDSEKKKAVVNPDYRPVYRRMVDLCMQGWTFTDIAWELNKLAILSPKGGMWSHVVVGNLLQDEVHLGHIVVGKTTKTATGDKIHREKEKWIVYKNCHEAVKTQEEHDKIIFLTNRNKRSSKASRAGKQVFSGLLYCACCSKAMQIQKQKNRPNDSVRSCRTHDAFGVRCINLGGSVTAINEVIYNALIKKKEYLIKAINEGISDDDTNELQQIASTKLKEIKLHEKRIEKIYRNQESMLYSEEEDENDAIFRERLKKAKEELKLLEDEYTSLSTQIERALDTRNEDLLLNIEDVLKLLNKPSIEDKEKNRALKSIINRIEWKRLRIDEQPTIYVNFL